MTAYFGITLTLIAFGIGTFLFKKTNKFFLFTPLFVAMILGILFLKIGGFDYATDYKPGGDVINFFLEPATIAFAIPLYKQRTVLKRYWFAIIGAIVLGSFASIFVVYGVSSLINVDHPIMLSLLPEAATTAIALPLSASIGGIASVTSFAVIFNAVIVYAVGRFLLEKFNISNPIARGLALGTGGHALGVAVALEMGEVEGAMASIAMVVVGVITVIVVPVFVAFL